MNKNIFQSIIFQININNRINNPISIENYLENNEIDNFDLIYKIENTDITVDNRLYLQRINEIQNLIELKKKFLYFLPISLKFDFNKLKTIVKRSNQTDFSVCILNHQLIKNNKDNIFFIIYRGINLDINIILKNSNSNNFNISLDKEIIDIYNQKYQLSGRIENIPKNKGEFIAIPLINDDSICVDFSYTDKLSYLRNEKPIMYANKKENNIFNFAQITDVKSEHIYDIILLDIDREYIVETINSYTYIPIDNKTKKNVYDTYKDGIKIKKYTEINISGFKSGIYLIDNKVKMIIKDHNNPIVFVYPSNTENIYNNFGGKCGYFKWAFNDSEEFQNNKERATQLSFHRPCSWMSHRFSIFTQTQEEEKKTNITDTQHKRHVCEIKCHARKNSDNFFI